MHFMIERLLIGRIASKKGKCAYTRQTGAVWYMLTECPALNMLLLSYSTPGGPGRLRHGTPMHTKHDATLLTGKL